MSKHNLHLLLTRYRNGNCTEKEKQLVEQWFSLLGEDNSPLGDLEERALEEKIWNKIRDKQNKGKRWSPAWKWSAAAIFLLVSSWWFIAKAPQLPQLSPPARVPVAEGMVQKMNSTPDTITFSLPDGSKVILAPEAVIEYPAKFTGETRNVILSGKAFFDVVRNPEMPFLVYTGEIVTKVLGTSFWVDDSDRNKSVEVSVVSGKVSVSKKEDFNSNRTGRVKSGVLLTANQKVTFVNESNTFETGLVETPVPVLTPEQQSPRRLTKFLFEDAPIAEVIRELELTYGIEIILENESLENCLFRGDISHQSLFTKLDLLCSSVNATYEVRGTRILISGKGCVASSNLR